MMLAELRADACYYHQLYFPGKAIGSFNLLKIILCSQGLWLLATTRFSAYYIAERDRNALPKPWLVLMRLFSSLGELLGVLINKSQIIASTPMDGGIYLSDHGYIILGARGVGAGTMIHERVTIGMSPFDNGKPEIGRNVWIGPDSVIYGKINIGDNATILPHTVLTKSLPSKCVVQGNPARIIAFDIDNSVLRQSLVCVDATISEFLQLCKVQNV